MAGETIRDVVIKIRLAVDKTDDIRKAMEQAVGKQAEQAQIASIRKVTDERKKAAAEQTKTTQQQIEEVRQAAEKQTRIEVAADRLKEIRMRERLAAFKRVKAEEVRIAKEAEAASAGTMGSRVAGAYAAASSFVQRTAINVLAATVIIENAQGFIKGLSEGLQKELKGSPIDEGPVTAFTRGLATALEELRTTARGGVEGIFGAGGARAFDATIGASGAGGLLEILKGAGLVDGKVTRRIGGGDTSIEKQVELTRQLNSILLERTKAERDLIDQERRRLDAAREEFGLLDARKKQGVIALAQKVGQQGIGGLTPEELDFARGNQAFRGILSEQAKAQADASGFDQIAKALGFDKRIADAQAKIEAEIKNVFDVKVDPENLAKSLEERLAPLIQQIQEKTSQKLRQELDLVERANRNTQGAAF